MRHKIKISPRHHLGLFKVELRQEELDMLTLIAQHFDEAFCYSACSDHVGMINSIQIGMLNNEPNADIYVCCASFADRVRQILQKNRLNGRIHFISALSYEEVHSPKVRFNPAIETQINQDL